MAGRNDRSAAGSRDRVRQWTVAASAVVAVVGAVIGSGAVGGTPIDEAAGGALSADSTPIAPAGPAFAIWSVIYAGLLAFAVWQFLPAHTASPRMRRLGYPVAVTLLLNAAWILSVQAGLLLMSVIVIVALLATLAYTFLEILRTRPSGAVEAIVVDGTMGLYLGWVCVATAANITAYLTDIRVRLPGLSLDAAAVLVLATAGLVGVLLAVRSGGRFAPALALCWGLAWVAVARTNGTLLSQPAAVTATVAAIGVAVATVALRLRASRRTASATD
ncbi:TspO/MBR family protein [Planctomonas psychrotolerans]|uniref:TspO/MBR family protein n=1 Tax=Planctomonas psychrotolerans TaxID=2528712 RepID=UPI0012398A06|nr:TspO/MBR family protein [Planctomonas psychrotolerans]